MSSSYLKGYKLQSSKNQTDDPISRYLKLTREVMPKMANDKAFQWSVKYDHCFQRIVLDTICNGSWYDHLERPAYKHLSRNQALKAVQLCEDIIAGRADLNALNRQSLLWRDKKVR